MEELGFVVMSGSMTAYQNKKGEWKKKFGFRPDWEQLKKSDVRKGENALAIVCGRQSGCSVIDIDDPTSEQNLILMDLMTECNMVQQTKHGFHYVWAYDERLRNTQGDKLDIRTDGGCIFTEPSTAYDSEGRIVASYKWIKTPFDSHLVTLPDEVVDYLVKIGGPRYVKGVVDPVVEAVVEAVVEPATTKILLRVIDALPVRYLDSYADWITLGMVLFNEGYTLDDWDRVSKRSSKYDGTCEVHWKTFKQSTRGVTGATAWKWLKESNKIEFYTLMEERNDFWDLIALLNHKDGARYFYNIHPDAYLWGEGLGWYALGQGNIWKHYDLSQPNGMKRHLADTLQELAMDTKKAELVKYARISENEKDRKKQEEATKVHTARITAIHSAYVKLGSSEFCNGVLAFLPSFYNDEKLEEKMDKNGRVFAFTDGLYDLETSVFRSIVPSDYISITCGYDYPKKSDGATRTRIQEFLYGLFENQETKDYLLRVLASCLFGGNRWEEFYVLTGNGGNGKSVVADILKYVFGNYYLSVNSSLLTKPVEKQDQPCPALVEARQARLMVSSEPEATDKLQVGLLKKMSGGDVLEARTLHSKKIVKYVAMFKLLLLANDIPALSKIDGGLTRRMRVIHFPFKFVASPSLVFERLGNPDLKDRDIKSAQWRNEFFLLLAETYKEIREWKSLPLCPVVKEQSEQYMDENNPVKEWLHEHYEIGGESVIPTSVLRNEYVADKGGEAIDAKKFSQMISFNGITKRKAHGVMVFVGITRKQQ